MFPQAKIDALKIPPMIERMGRRLRFVTEPKPYFYYKPEGDLLEQAEMIVNEILKLCDNKQ